MHAVVRIDMHVRTDAGFAGIEDVAVRTVFALLVAGPVLAVTDLVTHFANGIAIGVGIGFAVGFIDRDDRVIAVYDNERFLMAVHH